MHKIRPVHKRINPAVRIRVCIPVWRKQNQFFAANWSRSTLRCAATHSSQLVLPEQRQYCVVGVGALGGFYGAQLQRAGFKVHFLANSEAAHLKECGLKVDSKQYGNYTLPQVSVFSSNSWSLPTSDVVIVALKTTANEVLRDLLPRILAPGGVVLLLQNGFGLEAMVADIVGADAVVGGGAFLCSTKIAAGHIRHVDYGELVIGDYAPNYAPRGVTPHLQQLAQDFEASGIPVRLEADLLLARWKKLVWNIPYNGLCVLFNASTDVIMKNAGSRSLVTQIMEEVVEAATAAARISTPNMERKLPEDFAANLLAFTDRMAPYNPSMLLDYRAGRPLETEAIYGLPLKSIQAAGVAVPKIRMLYQVLQQLDAKKMDAKLARKKNQSLSMLSH